MGHYFLDTQYDKLFEIGLNEKKVHKISKNPFVAFISYSRGNVRKLEFALRSPELKNKVGLKDLFNLL